MDAGTEAGDRGGEPGPGADADRGCAQLAAFLVSPVPEEAVHVAVGEHWADHPALRCTAGALLATAPYAISSGLLYSWRQQVLGGQVSVVTGSAPSFARVELATTLQSPDGSEPVLPTVGASLPPSLSRPDGLIEIVLPNGVLVRLDAAVDGRALRRVLSALDDR